MEGFHQHLPRWDLNGVDVTGSLGHLLLRMFHLKLARWGKEKLWVLVPAGPKKKVWNESFLTGAFELYKWTCWCTWTKSTQKWWTPAPLLTIQNLIVTTPCFAFIHVNKYQLFSLRLHFLDLWGQKSILPKKHVDAISAGEFCSCPWIFCGSNPSAGVAGRRWKWSPTFTTDGHFGFGGTRTGVLTWTKGWGIF